MTTLTLVAPSGVSSVVGVDGLTYAVSAGRVTVPVLVAGPLIDGGYYVASAAGTGGATGATGSTGPTGATAA
jgi:hypothetical protein